MTAKEEIQEAMKMAMSTKQEVQAPPLPGASVIATVNRLKKDVFNNADFYTRTRRDDNVLVIGFRP